MCSIANVYICNSAFRLDLVYNEKMSHMSTNEHPQIKNILIVEDELPLSRALSLKAKKMLNVVCTCVYDGQSAIDALSTETFDAILLDLVIPHKNGFDVLDFMKEKNITTPTIVTSNLNQQNDTDRIKKYGVKEFFLKSSTPITVILETLQKYLV